MTDREEEEEEEKELLSVSSCPGKDGPAGDDTWTQSTVSKIMFLNVCARLQ